MSKRIIIALASTLSVAILVGVGATVIVKRDDIGRSIERATLPEEIAYHEITFTPEVPNSTKAAALKKTTIATPAPTEKIPAEMNLAIPFTSQAPYGTWDLPYQEFCEEASILMTMRYLTNQPITTADAAATGMNDIRVFEEKEFGYYEDTTADEVATIIKKHFGYNKVQVRLNPTIEDIKQAVAAGKPVLVPAAGRQLGNPYYTAPGPLYHMLVIKGFTAKNQFITHDPGTRHGAGYLYDVNVLMNAIHDWRSDGNIEQGRKVIIIVG